MTSIISFLSKNKKYGLELITSNSQVSSYRNYSSYAIIDWSVFKELSATQLIADKDKRLEIDWDYCTNIDNFPLIKQYIINNNLVINKNLFETYNEVVGDKVYNDKVYCSNLIKELYINPNTITSDIKLCIGLLRKGYVKEEGVVEEWVVKFYNSNTPEDESGVVLSFESKNKLNKVELISATDSSFNTSYILVDWSKFPELYEGQFGAIADILSTYNLNEDYVTNLNNSPTIKQYINEHTIYNKIIQKSITKYDTDNTQILNNFVKEIWLGEYFKDKGNISIGNLRKNYKRESEYVWQIIMYQTDISTEDNIASIDAFVSVNENGNSLELIKGKYHECYILVDWSVLEDGKQYFATTSHEFDLNLDYVTDINNFPIIKQYIDLQKTVNIESYYISLYNTPAISWVDDDFNLTSVPNIKSICDEVGCKCDFALVPTSTGGNNLDYSATYSISEEAVTLAKSYELEGFHIEMHPPHYGWYPSDSMGGEYSGRSWVENSLVKTIRSFNDNGILSSNCLVYPGSSGVNDEVIKMAANWIDYGINAGSGNLYNNGICNKYSLSRKFIDLSSSNNKQYYKDLIDDAVSNNSWLILGTHGHQFSGDTVDDTSNSLANLKEIIQYANDKCSITSVREEFNYRKPMLDLYK